MPAPDQVIRRAEVLWRTTLDGVLVRPIGGEEVVLLAGTGAALWDLLEEPLAFHDVCAVLASRYDAEPDAVAADLAPVIDDLAGRGVLDGV